MGIIESPSAVTSVKGIPSEVGLGKKAMENSECSYWPNSPRSQIVSAVRDFPPGCGNVNDVESGRQIVSAVRDFPPGCGNVNDVESGRYPPLRNVSAERSFPPFCGGNASLEARCVDQQQSDMGDRPSSPNAATASVQQTGDDGIQEEEIRENELGGNVPEVVEDEIQAELNGHAVQVVERQSECKIDRRMMVVSGDGRKNCIGTPQASNQYQVTGEDVGQSGEKLGKQIVVHREHNRPGGNCEGSGVLVLGLMAASNCPWIRGKEVKNRKPVVGAKERKRKKRDGGTSERKCKKQNGSRRNQIVG